MSAPVIGLERVIRRTVTIGQGHGAQEWIVTLTPGALEFRLKRHRFTFALPWPRALRAAERLAGDEELVRRQLRRRGLRDTRSTRRATA